MNNRYRKILALLMVLALLMQYSVSIEAVAAFAEDDQVEATQEVSSEAKSACAEAETSAPAASEEPAAENAESAAAKQKAEAGADDASNDAPGGIACR